MAAEHALNDTKVVSANANQSWNWRRTLSLCHDVTPYGEHDGRGRKGGYAALKATLHVLRDRIPPHSAVHLGDQLPTLIRGIYYENWTMAGKPTNERHLASFLDHLAAEIPRGMRLDSEDAAYAVFEVMSQRMDHGEIAKVVRMLSLKLRDLWPLLTQIDAAEHR